MLNASLTFDPIDNGKNVSKRFDFDLALEICFYTKKNFLRIPMAFLPNGSSFLSAEFWLWFFYIDIKWTVLPTCVNSRLASWLAWALCNFTISANPFSTKTDFKYSSVCFFVGKKSINLQNKSENFYINTALCVETKISFLCDVLSVGKFEKPIGQNTNRISISTSNRTSNKISWCLF